MALRIVVFTCVRYSHDSESLRRARISFSPEDIFLDGLGVPVEMRFVGEPHHSCYHKTVALALTSQEGESEPQSLR